MTLRLSHVVASLALVALMTPVAFADAPSADEGKKLYASQKFGCHRCHGPTGAEGGAGPSFTGVGKKYDHDALMERAAHNCPPTGACDPKQLGAIVEYLRTL